MTDDDDYSTMIQAAVIHQTYGKHPSTTLELVDEGDKVRIRVREPHDKASIVLTDDDLERLAREIAYMMERRKARQK